MNESEAPSWPVPPPRSGDRSPEEVYTRKKQPGGGGPEREAAGGAPAREDEDPVGPREEGWWGRRKAGQRAALVDVMWFRLANKLWNRARCREIFDKWRHSSSRSSSSRRRQDESRAAHDAGPNFVRTSSEDHVVTTADDEQRVLVTPRGRGCTLTTAVANARRFVRATVRAHPTKSKLALVAFALAIAPRLISIYESIYQYPIDGDTCRCLCAVPPEPSTAQEVLLEPEVLGGGTGRFGSVDFFLLYSLFSSLYS